MKKIILLIILSAGTLFTANIVNAQLGSLSININSQPAWGPTGYDYAGFYYFPDIDCYYDVNDGLFVYYDSGRWISARFLPYRYSYYDMYTMYKVVINTRNPWLHNRYHRTNYAQFRGHRGQVVIRDSRDNRYRNSRNNYVSWYSNQKSNSHVKQNNPNYNRPDNRSGNNSDYNKPNNSYNGKNKSSRLSKQDNRSQDRQNFPSVNEDRNNRREVKPSKNNSKTNPRLVSNQDNSRRAKR